MSEARFVRDRVTVAAYGSLGAYAFVLYSLGLVLPFLRTGLHLSYSETALHSTVFAGGSLVAGLGYAPLVARLGRRRVFWVSAGVMAVAALALAAARHVALSLPAAAVTGLAGSLLLVSTSVVLADRHGERRDQALVEANVVASACAVLAPLAFAAASGTVLTWRAGLLPPVVAVVVLYAAFRTVPMPAAARAGQAGGRLPAAARWLNLLVALVVAVEFCVVLWGVELLRTRHGLTDSTAAALLTAFYAGELAGRAAGSLLARPGRAPLLLASAGAVTTVGFLAFWLAPGLPLSVAGLVVTGLGVANLYPLALSLAVAAAEGRTELAAARAQLSVGSAVLAAPFLLGALADRFGVAHAFVVEPALLAATGAVLAVGLRASGTRVLPARRSPGR